nr:ATP synthase F0 subunit 6 [Megaginus tataupensis]
MCGLFSSFDPGVFPLNSFVLSGNVKWIFFFFFLYMVWWQFFVFPVGKDLFFVKIYSIILGFIKDTFFQFHKVSLILLAIFFFIFSMNFLGLLPFYFSISSHLSVNLPLSLTLWSSGVVFMLISSVYSFLSHMVPVGCPFFLWPLLVLVESVSVLIRPFTLSIRLMANVMAGHLILSLMGQFFSYFVFFLPMSFSFVGLFLLFEVCISTVQAYVFMSLLSLYWKESEDI